MGKTTPTHTERFHVAWLRLGNLSCCLWLFLSQGPSAPVRSRPKRLSLQPPITGSYAQSPTMRALSDAARRGASSLLMAEENFTSSPLETLGSYKNRKVLPNPFTISLPKEEEYNIKQEFFLLDSATSPDTPLTQTL